MVGWHHLLDGHGFEWTLGVVDGQGGLVCFSSWGRKASDMTEQSILKEISPGISLERMMLKLKLLYFDHLMQTENSLGRSLMLGKIEGRR